MKGEKEKKRWKKKTTQRIYITLRPSGIIYACALAQKEIPLDKYSQIGWKDQCEWNNGNEENNTRKMENNNDINTKYEREK